MWRGPSSSRALRGSPFLGASSTGRSLPRHRLYPAYSASVLMAGRERGAVSVAMTKRRLVALGLTAAALSLAAHEISELAEASGGGGASKVLVVTTGDHSETRRTVPITRRTSAK